MLGLGPAAAAPAATTPSTNLLLLSSNKQIQTNSPSSSSFLTSCSVRNAHLLHSSCRTIKAMAAEETFTVTTHDSKSPASGKRLALISLSDKKDLAFLGNGLQDLGYKIVSTGGTASALESAGLSVTKMEQITSFPEMLDGRVKTLHPNVHGGILARRDQKHHMEALSKHGIGTFDVVVVNLYPFYEKVTSTGRIEFEDGVENIDIGGPAMIRAAAKALAKEIREFRSPTDGETQMFYEIVVAPKYTKKGLEILRGKSKTLRILEARKNEKGKLSLRQVGGGWLAQDSDDLTPQDIQFKVVSQKAPQESELGDAEFAWLCVKHVKSNAIVISVFKGMPRRASGSASERSGVIRLRRSSV